MISGNFMYVYVYLMFSANFITTYSWIFDMTVLTAGCHVKSLTRHAVYIPIPCIPWYWMLNWLVSQSSKAVVRGMHPLYMTVHDDVIKWKHFPRYWPFVRRIHRSPVNSPHKGQWRWALMLTLICARINGWVNNREAGDLRRHRAHSDVIVMLGSYGAIILYNHKPWCPKKKSFWKCHLASIF